MSEMLYIDQELPPRMYHYLCQIRSRVFDDRSIGQADLDRVVKDLELMEDEPSLFTRGDDLYGIGTFSSGRRLTLHVPFWFIHELDPKTKLDAYGKDEITNVADLRLNLGQYNVTPVDEFRYDLNATLHGEMKTLKEYLDSQTSNKGGISPRVFIKRMKRALDNEPHRFGELLATYKSLLDRVREDLSPHERMQRALENLSEFAVLADHEEIAGLVLAIAEQSQQDVQSFFDNPQLYGSTMKAIAGHFDVEGPYLTQVLFSQGSTPS